MSKGALIIGGSLAGLQAALDLADSGIQTHIVETSPFLESNISPETDCTTSVPDHLLNTRLLEIAKHPNITVWTNTRLDRFEGEPGNLRVDAIRNPRYVDLSKCTDCGDCVEACPVVVPGTGHKAIFLAQGGQPGCAAIDKVGKPPCSNACPGGIHVQGYVALIAEGRFQEAIDLIREAIPFPGVCGRICTHPCELQCRRAEDDDAVSIRLLKRFVSDWALEHERVQPADECLFSEASSTASPNGRKVAIVGAGPGGMAAAKTLVSRGYRVTVFDRLPVIGGMMAVGIPEYRLPREVIAQEYRDIQDRGVEIQLNTSIGPNGKHTIDDLFAAGYEAICLAVGAHKSRQLRIPGEELPGVVHGIDLLRNISLSQQTKDPQFQDAVNSVLRRNSGTRVAVLGGGNTAMDVSRSLRRMGVRDVRILYRRTRAEMPAAPEEIEDAEHEGIGLEYLVSPIRVLGDQNNGVVGLECLRMALGEPDTSGRRRPVPIPGSEFTIDLDLVVLAIGQAPDLGFLGKDDDIAISRSERIQVDPDSMMTNHSGVFAAGDAVIDENLAVIEAIGMGKRAANAIDAYLAGQPVDQTENGGAPLPVSHRDMTAEELVLKARVVSPTIPITQRLNSFAEVELGYSAVQAIAEASRCLVCGPCSECQACVHACKPGAVIHDQTAQHFELDIGAVILTRNLDILPELGLREGEGLYQVSPDHPIAGSVAAAHVMFDLFSQRRPQQVQPGREPLDDSPRIGVFVCQCGDQISQIVDTNKLVERAFHWPGVQHVQTLEFSCSPEAASQIQKEVQAHNLDRVVLAACACCAFDQVCYSCTYQRVRCKDHLGIFGSTAPWKPAYEFVNIREQCAWPHADDPLAATAKATALVAAAVAKLQAGTDRTVASPVTEQSALIVGSGSAALTCMQALAGQGIAAEHVHAMPSQIARAEGRYVIEHNGRSRMGTAIILTPSAGEIEPLSTAAGQNNHQPRPLPYWTGLDTQRPGIFICSPELDPVQAGTAAAARTAAWLGRLGRRSAPTLATVDLARCRACGTCVEICDFGAPQLMEIKAKRTSWIDPAICTGCGTCAAHCPSGAITAGYSTDGQIEAMLEQILGDGW